MNEQMNEKELEQAAILYQRWSPAQLIRATTVERQQYLPEAIALMEIEISRRDLSAPAKNEVTEKVLKAVEIEKSRLHVWLCGTLRFFVILVFLNSLLSMLGGIYLITIGTSDFVLLGVLNVIWGVCGLLVFNLLIRRRPIAPRCAVWLMITAIPLNLLAGGFSGLCIIGDIGWLLYLKRSTRVAKAYLRTQDAR